MRSRTCEGVKVQTAEAEKTVSWQTNSKTSRGTNCTVNLQVQTRLQGLLLLLRRRSRAAIGLLSALQFHSITCSFSSSSNQKVNLQDKVHNQKTQDSAYPLRTGDPRRSRLGGGDRLGLLPRRATGEILLRRGEDLLLPRGGGLYNENKIHRNTMSSSYMYMPLRNRKGSVDHTKL